MLQLSSLLKFYTLFVPTDKVFDEFSKENRHRLTKDKDFLKILIMHHVVSGRYLTKQFPTHPTLTTTSIHTNNLESERNTKLHVYNGQEVCMSSTQRILPNLFAYCTQFI